MLLLIVFTLVSCGQNKTEDIEPINSNTNPIVNPNQHTELSYLALGDSYTIGESVSANDRWPVKLALLLKKAGYSYTQPRIIAKTGWTTGQLKAAINEANIQQKYNLVTLLIGVNDQYRGLSVESFRTEYIEVLNKAIDLAGSSPKNVLVVSIPDWGVSPFGKNRNRAEISEEIDLFNKVKREETAKRQVRFIDITGISRQALDNDLYIASDGLHFSGAMYQLWAEEIINRSF